MPRCCITLFSVLSLLMLLIPFAATATVIEATATPFTGDDLTVAVTVDDAAEVGKLVVTLEVVGGNIGDLRGFFVHISDESLLTSSGFQVSGVNVSDFQASPNGIIKVGGGNTLQGGGSPCPCDIGIEFGSPGIGKDDLQSVSFTLSHTDADLDVSLFAEQDFGIRATSVGSLKKDKGGRDGSSKLSGTFPVVPEPSTAVLMVLGLAGLSTRRTTRRTRAAA